MSGKEVWTFFRRTGWVWLAGVVVFGASLAGSDLRDDSLHYAAVSRCLLKAENPMILSLGDEIYLNKPPLFFWLTALAMKAFGVNAFAAKFVSLVFGVALVALIFHVGRKYYGGDQIGYAAAFAFMTSFTVFYTTRACRMESLLAFLMLTALVAWVRYCAERRSGWIVLWGLASGLAVLTKGPAGALPVAVGLIHAVMFERRLFDGLFAGHLAVGLAVFVGSFGWWYAYMLANTDFYKVFVHAQILQRVAVLTADELAGGAEALPRHSLFKYVRYLVGEYFYYLPVAVAGGWYWWRERRGERMTQVLVLFGVLWAISIAVLVTKYARYLYPLYPILSLLTATALTRWLRIEWWRALAVLAVGMAVGGAVWPGTPHANVYRVLEEVNQLAQRSDLPVALDERCRQDRSCRRAAHLYLDQFQWGPVTNQTYLWVSRRGDEASPGVLLYRTAKLEILLRMTAP